MKMKIDIDAFEVQLANGIVTTPADIRLDQQSVTVDFELGDKKLSYQFVLAGHDLRLVVRDMREKGVALSHVVLHDFSMREPNQPTIEIGYREHKPRGVV